MVCLPAEAQEEAEGSAEINAFVDGEIPSIKVTEWTPINLTIVDRCGINWSMLKQKFFKTENLSDKGRNVLTRFLWSTKIFGFSQPIQMLLGYTSLRLEPKIVQGDPKGWFLRVNRSTITNTTTGCVHKIMLEAKTDDSAVDYAVVIGINCTRYDTFGGTFGEDYYASSYIHIPVKASPCNFVEMDTMVTKKDAPLKSVVQFTVDVTNNGYYKDVFQFELREENGLVALVDKQAAVINPGDTHSINIDVLTPGKFFDPGTPSKIDVYIYSTGDPHPTLVGSLVVVTKGFYVSPLIGIVAAPIIIVLIVICVLFFYIKNKRDRELFGKPNKPWTLPGEKKYLDKLKEKDKEEYDKVRQMMKDEYQSALLWFKSYRNAMKQYEKERKQKESLEPKSVIKKEKIVKETKDIKKDKALKIESPKKTADQRRKEKVLSKIKREQEKQKLKIRG